MTSEEDVFKALSVIFGVLDVVSSALIADFVLRYKKLLNITVVIRLALVFLLVGFMLHAAEQIDLLADYRLPRSVSWVWIFTALHSLIIICWIRAHREYHKRKGDK